MHENFTRYEQYYNLTYKFIILNLSLTITLIKLETFFASKSQGGRMSPRPPCIRPWMSTTFKMTSSSAGRLIDYLKIYHAPLTL